MCLHWSFMVLLFLFFVFFIIQQRLVYFTPYNLLIIGSNNLASWIRQENVACCCSLERFSPRSLVWRIMLPYDSPFVCWLDLLCWLQRTDKNWFIFLGGGLAERCNYEIIYSCHLTPFSLVKSQSKKASSFITYGFRFVPASSCCRILVQFLNVFCVQF